MKEKALKHIILENYKNWMNDIFENLEDKESLKKSYLDLREKDNQSDFIDSMFDTDDYNIAIEYKATGVLKIDSKRYSFWFGFDGLTVANDKDNKKEFRLEISWSDFDEIMEDFYSSL